MRVVVIAEVACSSHAEPTGRPSAFLELRTVQLLSNHLMTWLLQVAVAFLGEQKPHACPPSRLAHRT